MKLKIHPKKDYDKKYNFISNVEKKKTPGNLPPIVPLLP